LGQRFLAQSRTVLAEDPGVSSTTRRGNQLVVRVRHEDGSWRHLEAVAKNCLDDPALGGVVINYRDVTEREARIEHLRLLEERYEKAFRNSPDSITISYVDDGRFVEVNEGFERLTGYSREEIVGRSALEIGIWKNLAMRERVIDELQRTGRVCDLLADFVVKSGAVRKGLYAAELIELDGRRCLLAVARDVTETVAAEQKLREAGEQLRREHAELARKNIALREVLEHLEAEKAAYRQEVAASIDNLLGPIIARLRAGGGRLTPREVDALADGLQAAIGGDIDEYRKNVEKLSPREHAICERIRLGRTSKEIAEELGLSEQTVHKHRQSIRRKLQLDRRGINLATYLRAR